MAKKRSDTYLFIRVPGKTIELLEMMMRELESETTIDLTNKSALSIVCEKFLADSVYHAAYGRLVEKYGDTIAGHYDPYYKSMKQEMKEKRAAKEEAKKQERGEQNEKDTDTI